MSGDGRVRVWPLAAVVAALALGVACGGADDEPAANATSAPETTAPAATTTTGPVRTTIPLVTVPDGSSRPTTVRPVVPTTTLPAAAATTAATTIPTGSAGPAPAPDPLGGLPVEPDDVDDIIETLPTIDPVEGDGTAIRAVITPTTDLAVGDIVTIEASNLPPGQFTAWGQCNETGRDAVGLGVLIANCTNFSVGIAPSDGTDTVTVVVADSAGGVDCARASCFIGIVALPGTDGYRVYERISLAS